MDLHPDLTELLTELGVSGAEYLVVGGWAVGVHSEPRYTNDLDLLIGTAPENLERVVRALEAYGAPPGLVRDVRSMKPTEFVFFGSPPARVDLLGEIPGVTFADAWARRETIHWNGTPVQLIARDDLIAAKKAAGRQKDLDDVKRLEKFSPSTDVNGSRPKRDPTSPR